MCMIFYRRDTHVAEIQMGRPASRVEDACAPDHFDSTKTPFVTLLCKCFFLYITPRGNMYCRLIYMLYFIYKLYTFSY